MSTVSTATITPDANGSNLKLVAAGPVPNPVGAGALSPHNTLIFDQIITNCIHGAFSTFSHHGQQTQQNMLHKFTTGEWRNTRTPVAKVHPDRGG